MDKSVLQLHLHDQIRSPNKRPRLLALLSNCSYYYSAGIIHLLHILNLILKKEKKEKYW